MIAGAACLVVNDALVKSISPDFTISQIILVRSIVIAAVCLTLMRVRLPTWRKTVSPDVILRTVFAVLNTFVFVAALTLLPFSVAVLVDYSSMLFVAVLAHFMLRERLVMNRIVFTIFGLFGAALILLPEVTNVGLAVLLPVTSAATGAAREVYTRRLGSAGHSPVELTFYAAILMTLTSFVVGDDLLGGVELHQLVPLVLAGLFQAAALILTAKAFHLSEAAIVAPFRLSALVWSVLISIFWFGDTFEPIQILGTAAILFALFSIVQSRKNRV